MFVGINRIGGKVTLRVSGDMPQRFLNNCVAMGVELYDLCFEGEYTITLSVRNRDMDSVKNAALKSCCELCVLRSSGGRRWMRMLRLRFYPALLAIIFVAILFWSKFYVWEIRVSGNESVPTGDILNALAECGVESGAFWPAFSSDGIRSEVLCCLPQLSWISVNMHGSLAEVIVAERKKPPEMVLEGESSDIIAKLPGFITAVETFVGQSCVREGSAVREGDLLISGAVESSFAPPRFLRSWGTVSAEVNTEVEAVMPEEELCKRAEDKMKLKYALIIGNNRINFYSDSSISDDFCDKIISVWKAEAEGLFSLPISLVCIEERYYTLTPLPFDGREASAQLETALRRQFELNISEPELISEKLTFADCPGLYTATLRSRCICSIGESVPISDARRNQVLAKYIEKADE